MTPSVSFLNIVSSWSEFLHGQNRSDFHEAVNQSWADRERMERLTRRFSELLHAKQQSLNERVARFIERCAADPRIANNRDYLAMNGEGRLRAFEKTVTAAGLIMREQLPLKQRRHVRRLIVDWNVPRGAAQWEMADGSQHAFEAQNAVQFAAKHVAGMDDELAALIAEKLTAEFRRGTMELTSLVKAGESEGRAIYEWQSASVSVGAESGPDDDRRAALPESVETPLLAWLRDEREITSAEIKRLNAHRPQRRPWNEARQLVEASKTWTNPDIVAQVEWFVRQCVAYSKEDRKIVAQEIALTVFHDLAHEIAAKRGREADAQRMALIVKTIESREPIGCTAELALAGVSP